MKTPKNEYQSNGAQSKETQNHETQKNKNPKNAKHAITPTRQENYPEWYQQVIKAAELAESAIVRGCMVIKPWGYAIWENLQRVLDGMIKDTGHQNFYCPMFVPLSLMQREAAHVEGFAKECAVVTHHRLVTGQDGKLKPASPLEEPLIIRPTSETIIGELFAKWVQSYRDLPVLMNQWANIVRWEMRPRLFLRTTEFLWQEGHTVHATSEEAVVETEKMLAVYSQLAEDYLAMPVIKGKKTQRERFPGAIDTYCIEAMMQDGKALQAGTSHFLGQNFAHAFNIKFLDQTGAEAYGWTTSWGVTTRLIGGIIMTHSDDDGLVLPPRIAPLHVVILPLIKDDTDKAAIMQYCENLHQSLQAQSFSGSKILVKVDASDGRAGDKAWGWVKKGVPIRIEVGKRELDNNSVCVGRRDVPYAQKITIQREEIINQISTIMQEIQLNLLSRAKKFRTDNTRVITSKDDFYAYFNSDAKTQPGFALAYWIDDEATEEMLKKDLKVSPRCIPLDTINERGKCIFTGQSNAHLTVFAKAY